MNPIFVVGCQRSGSTMLGAILGTHSKVSAIPEAQFIADCVPESPSNMAAILAQIQSHYRFKIWNYTLPDLPKNISSYPELIRWLVTCYAAEVNHKRHMAFWVDHQPGHIKHICKLAKQFPQLKVVHIIRDGRAVANSLIPLDWGPNSIHRAAYYWQQRLAYGLALKEFLPQAYFSIKYEDILLKPEQSIQSLCDFIGLDYEPNMLSGTGFKVPKFTQSQHALVGNGVNAKRIDSWVNQLSCREVEIFESVTGDLLSYLGYEKISNTARGMTMLERVKLDVLHLIKGLTNKVQFQKRVKRSIG
ncbi:sulfotransferase family protein [Catenovulum maritimum]|uniref:sulfotransferase family protein n=1 Tax=Catenovulum maritimum TaxID=1513271 RepID=UPI000660670B|nr:sulfotransferase [Catenovulum maritimum]